MLVISKKKKIILTGGDIPYGWGHGRRMSELQGAVARVQLNKLDNILDNIRKNYIYFEKIINDFGLKIRKQAYK